MLERRPDDAREVLPGDLLGGGGEQTLLLERAVDEVVDVGLAIAHGAEAVGEVDFLAVFVAVDGDDEFGVGGGEVCVFVQDDEVATDLAEVV